MKTHHTININGTIYDYSLATKIIDKEKVFLVDCPSAGILQEFYPEDIAEFLEDLPQWIKEYQVETRKKRTTQILFRVQPEEKLKIEKLTKQFGFNNISEYLRAKALDTSVC